MIATESLTRIPVVLDHKPPTRLEKNLSLIFDQCLYLIRTSSPVKKYFDQTFLTQSQPSNEMFTFSGKRHCSITALKAATGRSAVYHTYQSRL